MYELQIVLTHEHADAVLGLDDIRAVQPYSAINNIDPTPIYLTQFAMERYLILNECAVCILFISHLVHLFVMITLISTTIMTFCSGVLSLL